MNEPETPSPPKRRLLRLFLKALAAFVIIVVIFYVEEDWRGHRAWEACKSDFESKGIKLDWADFVPAPVPEADNIFGVPEMQKWFVGQGTNELVEKIHYPEWDTKERIVVAQLTTGRSEATAPTNVVEIRWEDAKAQSMMSRLVRQAVGPVVIDPS